MNIKRFYFQTEETVKTTRKGYIEMDVDFTQVYDCFEEISERINSMNAMRLLMYFIREMSGSNCISVNKLTLSKYNEYRDSKGSQAMPDSTFYTCVRELAEVGALKRISKGSYYLSAQFFWKGTFDNRKEFIQSEIKENRFLSSPTTQ